jgi:hypothetical protein
LEDFDIGQPDPILFPRQGIAGVIKKREFPLVEKRGQLTAGVWAGEFFVSYDVPLAHSGVLILFRHEHQAAVWALLALGGEDGAAGGTAGAFLFGIENLAQKSRIEFQSGELAILLLTEELTDGLEIGLGDENLDGGLAPSGGAGVGIARESEFDPPFGKRMAESIGFGIVDHAEKHGILAHASILAGGRQTGIKKAGKGVPFLLRNTSVEKDPYFVRSSTTK